MISDLAKLMEKISLLQSEELPEPIIEIEKPTMHPLVQAMQELRDEELREYNIRKTKKFIQRAHDQEQGQMYGDMPYSSHPKQVANLGKKFFGPKFNDEAVKVALLHDVLEDTPYTPEQLAKKGFSKEVIEAVQLLTKNKALSYADNIRAIINSGNPLAMMVKYSDNYMNYSGDKSHWDADRAAHSQKKYLASLNMLGDVLGITKHIDEEIAYHGTTDDITKFYPLSHFGTEKAAKDRMEYKKIKDGKIYKVDLDIKNPLTIKDFPGIHYDRLYAFELRDKKLISQKEMEAITTINDKAELRKALLTKLNELGIDGFVYKNKYEDKGNISYVIVDPSQVKVLSVEPAAEEVTEEFTVSKPRRQLNIPALIKQGAIFVTHPHGPEGWETDRPDWDFSLITLQNVLQKSPNWVADYKKYISNDKKLTQDFINRISDEKYQQILWSINKLGISDDVAFADKLDEASPNTLEGSFTPDLVESKSWLAEMLAKGLKGKNAGTIYVLGSWYGNMGIFLQQAGVQFDKLVLVEPDEEALMRSKDLLQQIGDEGKLILIHQKAEDVVYEKPGVVINTSCNETGPVFLTKLPDNMLCLLQARNNNENTLFPTEDEEDFIDYFPLEKVYYTGKKQLEDPEVNYVRYMKIGRTGKSETNDISY